jgi:hypothetical protein
MQRLVSGALRDAINAHGPITSQNYASATKRIAKAIRVKLIEQEGGRHEDFRPNTSGNGVFSRYDLERSTVRHTNESIGNAIRDGIMVMVSLGPPTCLGVGFSYGILNGITCDGVFTGQDLYGNQILYDFRGDTPVVSWAEGSSWGATNGGR